MGSVDEEEAQQPPDSDQALRQAMQRLWEADGESLRRHLPQPQLTQSEKKAISEFHDTLQRLSDGRYQAGLLWKITAHCREIIMKP